MNIIIPLVVGIVIGWAVSLLKAAAGQEDLIRNVVVGVAGAYIGGWLLGKLFEISQTGFSVGTVIVSLVGAITLLFVMARLQPE